MRTEFPVAHCGQRLQGPVHRVKVLIELRTVNVVHPVHPRCSIEVVEFSLHEPKAGYNVYQEKCKQHTFKYPGPSTSEVDLSSQFIETPVVSQGLEHFNKSQNLGQSVESRQTAQPSKSVGITARPIFNFKQLSRYSGQ